MTPAEYHESNPDLCRHCDRSQLIELHGEYEARIDFDDDGNPLDGSTFMQQEEFIMQWGICRWCHDIDIADDWG